MLSRYFSNPKDKADFGIAVVVIALAGILIGYFSFFGSPTSAERPDSDYSNHNSPIDTLDMAGVTYVAAAAVKVDDTKKVRKKQPVNEGNPSDDVRLEDLSSKQEGTLEKSESESVAKAEGEIDPELGMDSDDVGISNGKVDLLDSIIADENIVEEDEGPTLEDTADTTNDDLVMDEKSDEITENVPESEAIVEEAIVAAPEKEIPKKAARTKKRNKKKKFGCIVVIGAYGNASNIKKMIGKLDRAGYQIFKVPYNGLTRVGVYEECAKANTTLKYIQRKYSSDAFVMKAQ